MTERERLIAAEAFVRKAVANFGSVSEADIRHAIERAARALPPFTRCRFPSEEEANG